jgi:predicted Zn-dependent protease
MKQIIAFLTALLLIAGCAKAPVTGRSQLILVSPSQEMQLGLSASEQMRRKVKLSSDRVTSARIERVGRRIVSVLGDVGYQWQFFLVEGEQVNAFALPGGHVYFYTGIMKLMENDDQIATVMGHEIAHVLARHGAERMSLQMLGTYLKNPRYRG